MLTGFIEIRNPRTNGYLNFIISEVRMIVAKAIRNVVIINKRFIALHSSIFPVTFKMAAALISAPLE